jgi:hypothetical protein
VVVVDVMMMTWWWCCCGGDDVVVVVETDKNKRVSIDQLLIIRIYSSRGDISI